MLELKLPNIRNSVVVPIVQQITVQVQPNPQCNNVPRKTGKMFESISSFVLRTMKNRRPEIFRFYSLYFRAISSLGVLPYEFDSRSLTLIRSTKRLSKIMFQLNWAHVNIFLAKNTLLLLLDLFPNAFEGNSVVSRQGVIIFKLIWFASIFTFWTMFYLIRQHEEEWTTTISMWIQMERYVSGK